jgi:hypothetical protein
MNERAMTLRSAPEDGEFLKITALPSRVLNLRNGERLTLVGVASEEVWDALRGGGPGRPTGVILQDSTARNVDAIFDNLLDDLAAVALTRFPPLVRTDATVQDLIAFAMSAHTTPGHGSRRLGPVIPVVMVL